MMKIGDIARELDCTVRTLRFYEEQGLIHPQRSGKGTRIYDEEDRARFAAILSLARLGFSLQSIAALAAVRPASASGDEASHEVFRQLGDMTRQLATQREAIERAEADLAQARKLVEGCFGCEQPPRREVCAACTVGKGAEKIEVLHVVWDEPQRADTVEGGKSI